MMSKKYIPICNQIGLSGVLGKLKIDEEVVEQLQTNSDNLTIDVLLRKIGSLEDDEELL